MATNSVASFRRRKFSFKINDDKQSILVKCFKDMFLVSQKMNLRTFTPPPAWSIQIVGEKRLLTHVPSPWFHIRLSHFLRLPIVMLLQPAQRDPSRQDIKIPYGNIIYLEYISELYRILSFSERLTLLCLCSCHFYCNMMWWCSVLFYSVSVEKREVNNL